MKVISLHHEEQNLIQQAIVNNRQAQQQLYSKFAPKMLGVCRQYIKDVHQVEDVMITAFMKVFVHLNKFEHKGSFEGWIRRIMVNECISFLRVNKKMNYVEDTYYVEESFETNENHYSVEEIQSLIDTLPEGYKMVFNLYAIEGYKHQEIAKLLGISEGTSKSQLSHARKMLQQQINCLKISKMGQNNFEQQVKEKLSNREIAPSVQAWDRLDAMLTLQEAPKKKMTWWYVAATVSGLLLVGTLFFNQSKESNVVAPSQEIVVTSTENNDSVMTQPSIEPKIEVSVQSKSAVATNLAKITNKVIKNSKTNHQELSINNPIKTSNKPISTTAQNNTIHQAIAAIDEKVQVAPTEIQKNKKIQVDPSTLLSQVDGELELSFREKVIAKVNKNYQTVKVALANRNNQE